MAFCVIYKVGFTVKKGRKLTLKTNPLNSSLYPNMKLTIQISKTFQKQLDFSIEVGYNYLLITGRF
jgi:hypothetical protein